MYQEFYAGNSYVGYAVAAFVFFLGVFLFVLVQQLFGMRSGQSLEQVAALPFEDKEYVRREQT